MSNEAYDLLHVGTHVYPNTQATNTQSETPLLPKVTLNQNIIMHATFVVGTVWTHKISILQKQTCTHDTPCPNTPCHNTPRHNTIYSQTSSTWHANQIKKHRFSKFVCTYVVLCTWNAIKMKFPCSPLSLVLRVLLLYATIATSTQACHRHRVPHLWTYQQILTWAQT
jgi:hypothetical protein